MTARLYPKVCAALGVVIAVGAFSILGRLT